jgi:hypothetical protein
MAARLGERLDARLRLLGLASITVSFLGASFAPTPLYAGYQAAWGFSALTTTVVFGVYAITFLGALLTARRLSDHIGGRQSGGRTASGDRLLSTASCLRC